MRNGSGRPARPRSTASPQPAKPKPAKRSRPKTKTPAAAKPVAAAKKATKSPAVGRAKAKVVAAGKDAPISPVAAGRAAKDRPAPAPAPPAAARADDAGSVGKRSAASGGKPRTASRAARDGSTSASTRAASAKTEGWHGWDDYAAFYDWENARTVGRRDVAFWRDLALRTGGLTLELGCGTGRILTPLARAGVPIVGIDRSAPMLARAEARVGRVRRNTAGAAPASLLRGDIRQLPFEPGTFELVMAPYGILQSLVRDRDLADTLRAVFDALAPGGRFGLDLVPDVPRWEEYSRRVSLRGSRGPRGVPVTLVESVRQDRARRLTIFDQEFIEGQGRARRVHRFSLTFRTVSIQSLRARLERAGFRVDAVLGGYDGRPWDPRADTWVLLASKPA